MWQFWVDRGGTFTDIVAQSADGQLLTHKLLSENPEHYKDAAVAGIRHLMGLGAADSFPVDGIESIKMGTTVATNALLERKGDNTLLLITKGFSDLLRIGYQNRPNLFDLQIVLPDLLYDEVAEIDERLDAHGLVLTQLNLQAARLSLQSAFDSGTRGVAIALMHAYLNPSHELLLAELAQEIGFTQISTSHQTSKLIKLVGRGDTTVVDAYLSPILRRYVRQVTDALEFDKGACRRLFFMQSNGGLIDASLFNGKDSILSGPAGGVVGMVETAESAGFKKLIGFDMGGTSTDVCHYAGEYERSFETEVAGIRMRAPMMNIHTVAAGGGSILNFRDGRYQVGPESAGANPGPACYRRGGPLTVTDCNVMLGKLQPDHFPAVFGASGQEPLDISVVERKFEELATRIAQETGAEPLSAVQTAEGFLRIAVENMANAIKKISVQRGYDITQYTLNCFGGAGGQHACLVADALGMESVFLHPYAGVLSAYGMGLADIRALREEQFDQPLSALEKARNALLRMGEEVRADVISQGVDENQIEILHRAHLKYAGSHQSIEVEFGSELQMRERFHDAHSLRFGFGFSSSGRELLFDMLGVEAIGRTQAAADNPTANTVADSDAIGISKKSPTKKSPTKKSPTKKSPAIASTSVSMVVEEKRIDVLLYDRESLERGAIVIGPAIIKESTGTTILEPGWTATVDEQRNLILTRHERKQREAAIGTSADPVMLEVFNNLFMSIAEQMGTTLANTAYSVNIKERLDFSCALFDAQGNLVANAPHVPVHLGSMSESVRIVARINRDTMKSGDSYLLNAPFNGGTHLPDLTVITPVFDHKGEHVLFYVGSRGHHADIGGRTPGSAPPDSKHIEEEGVVIDNFLLVSQGKLRESETRALLASGKYPCRNIDENMADLEAQIAANATGIREVHQMIDNFTIDVVHAYMKHVQANAEASVRRVIGKLKNSSYEYPMDSGAVIKVTITVDQDARDATIDFTGTSAQAEGNYNAPLAVCHAVVLYVFRTLVSQDIPLNEGCLKPLKIIAPEGSMINATYPAAVIAGNTEVSQSITDCLYAALGAIAGSQGTVNNFVWGNEKFQNYETIAGGTGAGPGFNGVSAVHSHMTNTRMTDPEVLERRFPVRVEEFSIRNNSAGVGQWSGGEGIKRIIRFLDPVTVTTLASHRITRPSGGDGGGDGGVGIHAVIRSNGNRQVLGGNAECNIDAGDMFEIQTPGGGGWSVARNSQ